jgi:Fe2+ or Zn2+ uptake regulation protein
MVGTVKSPEDLTTLFRRHGRKITPQRQCIFGVLQGDVTHPTAESVHAAARAKMETISLKTVYQTLNELAALGEIAALDLGTGTIRFDPNVELVHHHLVCRSCGKVRDLHADFSSLTVPLGWAEGFEVGEAEVVFRGLCGECRTRARSHRRRSSSGTLPQKRASAPPTSRMEISSEETSSNRNYGEHTSRRSTRQKRKG